MSEINKKMLGLVILQILREYTDENHRMTQQEILKVLKRDYDVECDRRSVKSNCEFLQDMGYDVVIEGKYYLRSREFDDAELRLLIDSVLFSRVISTKQARELIRKLEAQSNKFFSAQVSHVANLPEGQHTDNHQVFENVGTINEAIDRHRKIQFTYNRYDTDFRMHPSGHNPRQVSPYQMVANNGRYYLLCYDELHGGIAYYRIDRMTDVTMQKALWKPLRSNPGMEHGLDLPRHMAEHLYMFSGDPTSARLRVKKAMMGDLIDWFGKDFSILQKEEDYIVVRVLCNEQSLFYWSMQYGMAVEVLSPTSLRERIRTSLHEMILKYQDQ